jgi:DNA-binding response OmpR family regulator
MSYQKVILVVEDQESLQRILKIYLEDIRFEVFQARTLEEARDAFDQHGIMLSGIIMDHKLGEEYSIDLVKKIREVGFNNPIIAFSGDEAGQQKLLAAGCSHRIDGKGTVSDFIDSIRQIIPI